MKDTGRLASVLSAVAVVLSLVFVGYEIRQNTAMMRGATMQSISDAYMGYVTSIGLDAELAELFRRFHRGEVSADFTPTENTRLILFFNAFVQILENSYLQHREGLVPDAVFEGYGWGWGMIQTERFREYWENSSGIVVGSEFAEFFENRVQIGPG